MKKFNIKDLFKGKGAPLTKAEKKKKTILLLLKIFPLNFVFGFLAELVAMLLSPLGFTDMWYTFGISLLAFFVHPLYLALVNAFEKDYSYLKRLLEMFLFLSPSFLMFLGDGDFAKDFAMLWCIYAYSATLIFWSILYQIRKLYEKLRGKKTKNLWHIIKDKKILFAIFKNFPLPLTLAFSVSMIFSPLILFGLIDIVDLAFESTIDLGIFLHPFYIALLNALEKEHRFTRRLLEMSLFLSPYFLLFLRKLSDHGIMVARNQCIYVYAAMIISWTIFYFIRKFYDKKYKAKAVEAEN